MAIGPLARILAQVIVPVIATLARALPAAYAQALQNARKGGINAETAKKAGSNIFGAKNKIDRSEALQILNLTEKPNQPVTIEAVRAQYEKYMAANDVKKGGSFYLQSKIYRAKELLEEYDQDSAKEQQQEEKQ